MIVEPVASVCWEGEVDGGGAVMFSKMFWDGRVFE